MELNTKVGARIIFTGKGGYKMELEKALELLNVNQEYTLAEIVVDSWSTAIQLVEFPDEWFNSVQFNNVK